MLIPDLPRTSPERQGIASSALLRFVEALDSQVHELHGFMLLRHGSVVAEGWWSPYRRDDPHMLFSLSKSFTSTAVGLAVAEGYFSIDDPVLSFFPDEADRGGERSSRGDARAASPVDDHRSCRRYLGSHGRSARRQLDQRLFCGASCARAGDAFSV